MPRVCQLQQCGKAIVDENGRPDFSEKRFCSPPCRAKDKKERMAAMRARDLEYGHCPRCGQGLRGKVLPENEG